MDLKSLSKVVDECSSELIELFRSIIRYDTSNPPGNELPLANYLYDVLSREGIECEVIESGDNRGNIIAKLEGEVSSKRILYLSHLDVVPPGNVRLWSHNPFAADFDGKWIYGRGALDCKSLVAAEAFSLIMLRRLNVKPKYTLIFASTADEETGGRKGIGWIVEKYPEKVRADFVINEGGGIPIRGRNDTLIYLVDVAEKGSCRIRLKFHGKGGHSSVPFIKDNALYNMSLAVRRLYDFRSPTIFVDAVREMLEVLFPVLVGFKGKLFLKLLFSPLEGLAFSLIERFEPNFGRLLKSLTRMTIAVTIVKGGVKENVIPSECEAIVNCRLLPGQDGDYALSMIKEALKDLPNVEVKVEDFSLASSSPVDKVLLNGFREILSELIPNYNLHVAPFLMPGSSDSRYLRSLGAIVYGFSPINPEIDYSKLLHLAHGVDEKIDVGSLILTTKFLTLLPLKLTI